MPPATSVVVVAGLLAAGVAFACSPTVLWSRAAREHATALEWRRDRERERRHPDPEADE